MDGFMPSEIARLVLGYLKEVKCDEAYKAFLSENWDLQEYQRQLNRGKEYPTSYAGKTLLSILDEYYQLKVKGNVSSSNRSSDSASSCRTPPNQSQSSVVVRTCRSVVASVHNEDLPSQPTRSRGRVIPPRNLFSSPRISPSKSRIRSVLRFETPKKSDTGVFRSSVAVSAEDNKTESVKKSSPSASTSQCSGSGSVDHMLTGGIVGKEGSSHSKSPITTSTSSLYINSSVQTCLTFTSSQTDGKLETPVALTATASSVPSSEVNDTVSSPNVSSRASISTSPLGATGNFEGSKLPEDRCGHDTDPTENLPDCSESQAASAVPGNETYFSTLPLSLQSGATTPDTNHEPPPYQRAPATNSPRITLSLERSVVPSLSTPVKQHYGSESEFKSPSRKKSSIPRRRLVSESSPAPKTLPQSDIFAPMLNMADTGEQWAQFEQNFMPLINKLTENINIVKSCEDGFVDQQSAIPVEGPPAEPLLSEDVMIPPSMIKNILERTESDPVFEECVAFFSEKFEACREDCDVNMMFLSPFRQSPSTPHRERNAGTVVRKLLISGDENRKSNAETFGRQCGSFENQQQLSNKETEVHNSSNCSYDGGGSIAHSTEKQSCDYSWNNANTNTHQGKEQSNSEVKNIVGSPLPALPISSSVGPTGSDTGSQQTCQNQDTPGISALSHDLCDGPSGNQNTDGVLKESSAVSNGTVAGNTDSGVTKLDCSSSQNEKLVTSDTVSPNDTLGDICKAAGIYPFNTPSKLENQKSPQYKAMSTTPVKWRAGTSSPIYKSYKLSIADDSSSTPSVIFVPQNATELNAVPGSSSAYLIIHAPETDTNSGNVINPPLALAPCAEVEMVTIGENQVVSTKNSLVPVVSSVPPTQPFSVLGSNTSNETYWVSGCGSPSVNLASDIQYVTVVSPGQQRKLSKPIPIAMAPPGRVIEKQYYPLVKKGRTRAPKTQDDAETARIRANIMRDLNLGKRKTGWPKRSVAARNKMNVSPRIDNFGSQAAPASTDSVNQDDHIPASSRHTPTKRSTRNEGQDHPNRHAGTRMVEEHEQNEDNFPYTGPLTRAKCNEEKNSPSKCNTPVRRGRQNNVSNSPVNRANQNIGETSPSMCTRSMRSPKMRGEPVEQTERENLRTSVVANFDALKQNASPKLKSLINSVRQHMENTSLKENSVPQYLGNAGSKEKSCARVLHFGPYVGKTKPSSTLKKRGGRGEFGLRKGRMKTTSSHHSIKREAPPGDEAFIASTEDFEVIDLTSPDETPGETSLVRELVISIPRVTLATQQEKMSDAAKSPRPLQNSALSSETDTSPLKKRVLKSHAQDILKQQKLLVPNPDEVVDTENGPHSLSGSTGTFFNPECAVERTDLVSHNEDELHPVSKKQKESPAELSEKLSVCSSEQTVCDHDVQLTQEDPTGLATVRKGQGICTPTKSHTVEDIACVEQTCTESLNLKSPQKVAPFLSPTRTLVASEEQSGLPIQETSPKETGVPCGLIQGMTTIEGEETAVSHGVKQTGVLFQEKESSHSFEEATSETPGEELYQKGGGRVPARRRGRPRKDEMIIPLALCSVRKGQGICTPTKSHTVEDIACVEQTCTESLNLKSPKKVAPLLSPTRTLVASEERSGLPTQETSPKETGVPCGLIQGMTTIEGEETAVSHGVKQTGVLFQEKESSHSFEEATSETPGEELYQKEGGRVPARRRGRLRKDEMIIPLALCSHSSEKASSEIPCEESCQKEFRAPARRRGRPKKEEKVILATSESPTEESQQKQGTAPVRQRRRPRKGEVIVPLSDSSGKAVSDLQCEKLSRRGQQRKEQTAVSVVDNSSHSSKDDISHSHDKELSKLSCSRKGQENVLLTGSSHPSEKEVPDAHRKQSSGRGRPRKEKTSVSPEDSSFCSDKDISDSHCKESPKKGQQRNGQTNFSPTDNSYSSEKNVPDLHQGESLRRGQSRKEQAGVLLADGSHSPQKDECDSHQKESLASELLRKDQKSASVTDSFHSLGKGASDSHNKELPERRLLTEKQTSPAQKDVASNVHSKESSQIKQQRKEQATISLVESSESSEKVASDLRNEESPQQDMLRKEQKMVSLTDGAHSSEKCASDLHGKELLTEEIMFRSSSWQRGRQRKENVPSQTLYSRRLIQRLAQEEKQKVEMETNEVKNRSLEGHFGKMHINRTAHKEAKRPVGLDRVEKTPPNLLTAVSRSKDYHDKYSAVGREFQRNEQQIQDTEEQSVTSHVGKSSPDKNTIVNNLEQHSSFLGTEKSHKKETSSVAVKSISKPHTEASGNLQDNISDLAATDQNTEALSEGKTVNICCFCCKKIDKISQQLSQSVDSTPFNSSIRFIVTTDSSPKMESAFTQTQNSRDLSNVKKFTPTVNISLSDNVTTEVHMLDSEVQHDEKMDQTKQDGGKGSGSRHVTVDCKETNQLVLATKDKEGSVKSDKRKAGIQQHAKMDMEKIDQAQQKNVDQLTSNTTDKYSVKQSLSLSSSKATEKNPVERRRRKRKAPPPIPAGVKLPSKWKVSNINMYSNALSNVISPYPTKRRKCTLNEKDRELPSSRKKLNENFKKSEPTNKIPPMEDEEESLQRTRRKSGACQLIYSSDESETETTEKLVPETSNNHTCSGTTSEKEPPPRRIAVPSAHDHTDSYNTPPEKHPNKHSSTSHNNPAADSSPEPQEDYNEVASAIAFLKETEKPSGSVSFEIRDSLSEVGCELTIGKSPSSEPRSSCNSSSIFNVGDTKKRKASSSEKNSLKAASLIIPEDENIFLSKVWNSEQTRKSGRKGRKR